MSVEWPSGPVLEGSFVELSCHGSANPPVDNYTWYRSYLGPDQKPNQRPLGFKQSFTAWVSEDTQYYCEMRNPYGVQSSNFTQMDVHCESDPLSMANTTRATPCFRMLIIAGQYQYLLHTSHLFLLHI